MGSELSTFNVKHGYAEALVRGYRQCLLTPDDYRRLQACENLEDLRSCLEDTEYGTFLQDEPLPLSASTVAMKCQQKFADDFRALQAQASQPLTQFLEYLVAERMIDTVVSIMQGSLNGKGPEELAGRAHPLVWRPEMKAILAVDPSAGFEELYRSVLVETPIGRYFEDCFELQILQQQASGRPVSAQAGVEDLVGEIDLEIIRASLKKAWLEDFHQFCLQIGGTTAEVMDHVLKVQADFLSLSVTLNSLNTPMGGSTSLNDRNALYPAFGYIYPAGTDALRKAYNDQTIRAALENYPEYAELYEKCRGYYMGESGSGKNTGMEEGRRLLENFGLDLSLEDAVFTAEVRLYELVFERQMHFGVYYAWTKLREQEIRNIVWIAEMTVMNRPHDLTENNQYVLPIFAPRY